jgi:hypothetical protein
MNLFDERERVVAWMREELAEVDSREVVRFVKRLASRIEAGEHWDEGEDPAEDDYEEDDEDEESAPVDHELRKRVDTLALQSDSHERRLYELAMRLTKIDAQLGEHRAVMAILDRLAEEGNAAPSDGESDMVKARRMAAPSFVLSITRDWAKGFK